MRIRGIKNYIEIIEHLKNIILGSDKALKIVVISF